MSLTNKNTNKNTNKSTVKIALRSFGMLVLGQSLTDVFGSELRPSVVGDRAC